jgi:hypothetical protein
LTKFLHPENEKEKKMNDGTICVNCGKVGEFSDGWYEVDDGDLCPECAQMLEYDEKLDD